MVIGWFSAIHAIHWKYYLVPCYFFGNSKILEILEMISSAIGKSAHALESDKPQVKIWSFYLFHDSQEEIYPFELQFLNLKIGGNISAWWGCEN